MVADLRYFNSLEHEVDTLKSQLETQKTQFLNEIDRLSREYYYADHMNAILGVYTDLDEVTNLQCDYLETWEKCERLEKELSKSRTMSKSFEALQKHAINLELDLQQCKEKIKNDKSFKENHKKTVATDSTVKKSRNITRKLYEQVSKTCSWWYPKYTPPGYNWKPKSQKGNVNPNISMPLGNASRTANILEHKTPRCSTVSNTPLSSNSFAARTVKFGNDQIAPILGSRGTDLYSISLQDSTTPNPICLMAKPSKAEIRQRSSVVLLRAGKQKEIESINGKKYVLVIVDDYSRYTWTHFLRSKDETPGVLIDFLTLVQRGLHAQVTTVRT
ncbi:retrovirus-related pol polyprotein from transposon TNT 1-94 [Tanacetum coccineum]